VGPTDQHPPAAPHRASAGGYDRCELREDDRTWAELKDLMAVAHTRCPSPSSDEAGIACAPAGRPSGHAPITGRTPGAGAGDPCGVDRSAGWRHV